MNARQLATDMLKAAQTALKAHTDDAHPYLKMETKKLAETAQLIADDFAAGDITPKQAKILVKMQADASASVLTAIDTIGRIAAQDAINAALKILKTTVNSAVGIALL
jgi:F0F1-type ATP synthase membrane subunit b/b'